MLKLISSLKIVVDDMENWNLGKKHWADRLSVISLSKAGRLRQEEDSATDVELMAGKQQL